MTRNFNFARKFLLFALWQVSILMHATGGAAEGQQKLTYPDTHRSDHVDAYHGVQVADPYRWLEDPDSQQTRDWVAAQNAVTFPYLQSLPGRVALEQRLTELWDYERYGVPRQRGGRYFFTRNDGLQNQSVLYVADSLDAEPRVLLDPNLLSEDGTVSLAGWVVSQDGRWLAYGLADGGSDWQRWKVREVATGQDLSDDLQWVKFSHTSWTEDSQGFFYSRYDAPEQGQELTDVNYYQKLYYHRVGQPQEADQLVYQRPDEKQWGFAGQVTEDGQYLIISVWRGTEEKNQVFYKSLAEPDSPVVELLAGFDAQYDFLGNDGATFWFLTDLDAPLRRVVAIDIRQPAREAWRELIPQDQSVLEGASVVGDQFFAVYLQDAASRVRLFDLNGQFLRDLPLPSIGSAGGFGGRRDDRETFYSFTNFTTPTTIYRYDLTSGSSTVFRRPQVAFDPDAYETRQVFYPSKDGTPVPMFITARKDLPRNGDQPTLLYAYGGFNISVTPQFSVTNLVWLEQGGVYAVANLRGGGEYGRAWHEAGMLENKQTVFDDFLAAAQWLIDQGYTRPQRLGIRGGSNGGLLVGAAMTQRPDLFGAALPAVGVMDMLRFHQFTIGWAWVSEYGSSADPDQFRTLLAYSPLHNLRAGVQYPATLVTTADHDDRVVPAHSFKFAAQLQHVQGGDAPVLIRIETSAGHGAGTPTSKLIAASADWLAFLQAALTDQ
jgi:prolyl oligopeptidase